MISCVMPHVGEGNPMDDSRDGNDDNDDTAAAGANAGHRLGT